jgi:8-oxo-dGTP diphosphatase
MAAFTTVAANVCNHRHMSRYATTGEAAKAIDVSRSTLQRWANTGLVPEAWWRTPAGQLRWDLGKLKELLGITMPPEHAHDPAAPLRPAIVAAIITSARGVLLTRRHDGKPLYGFPAGEAEPGESPEDATIREVKEETGLQVKVSHVIGERDHPVTGRHMIYLAGRPEHGTDVHVGDTDELAEVAWYQLADATERLGPTLYAPVRDHLAHVLTRRRAG